MANKTADGPKLKTKTIRTMNALAEALDLSREQFDRLRQSEYFPDLDGCRLNDGSYDVPKIVAETKRLAAVESTAESVSPLPEDAETFDLPQLIDGVDADGNDTLTVNVGRTFRAKCPNEPPNRLHAARVKGGGTKGRLRYCICDTCGCEFQQIGDFADARMDLLHRIQRALQEAHVGEQDGKRFVLMSDDTRKQIIQTIQELKNWRG